MITTLEDWDEEKGLTFIWILTQPVNGIHLNFLLRFIYVFWFQKNWIFWLQGISHFFPTAVARMEAGTFKIIIQHTRRQEKEKDTQTVYKVGTWLSSKR